MVGADPEAWCFRDEEDEESVDARVARIRKRVQELTAGMGDDD